MNILAQSPWAKHLDRLQGIAKRARIVNDRLMRQHDNLSPMPYMRAEATGTQAMLRLVDDQRKFDREVHGK